MPRKKRNSEDSPEKIFMDMDAAMNDLPEGVHTEGGSCECYNCKYGPEAMEEFHRRCMEAYGWFFHYVGGDDTYPLGINIHTHGVKESFGHPDIQIVFPVSQETAQAIMNNIVGRIENGEKFEVDTPYDDILGGGYKVKFIWAKENERDVLRLILPDANHGYTGDFAKQLIV